MTNPKRVASNDIAVYLITSTWCCRSCQNNPIKMLSHCDLASRVGVCVCVCNVAAQNAKFTLWQSQRMNTENPPALSPDMKLLSYDHDPINCLIAFGGLYTQ